MERNKQKNIATLIIIIFSFLLYGNTIKNKYSLDDNLVGNYDKDVRQGLNGIPNLLISHYGNSGKLKYGYRPIVKITYAIEYQFFGKNPHVSHLINILLYALLLVVLFNTLLLLFKSYSNSLIFSLLVVLLFASHPLHTEVVASLKNRDALLSFLGGISGLFFIHKFVDKARSKFLIFAILSFLFGYLSKPDTMVFAAIYPVSLFVFTKYSRKKIILIFILFIALLVLVRYIPRQFLTENYRPKQFFENPLYFHRTFLIRIQAAFHTTVFYLKMLFYPQPLLFYYGYNMVPVYGFTVISVLSGVFHLGGFSYAVYIVKRNKILSFGILFYLIAISMFLNFLVPSVGIVAERFTFTALLGFCIVLVWFLFKMFKMPINSNVNLKQFLKTNLFIVFLLIIFVFSIKTIIRNNDWYDDLSLYKSDIKYLNNSAKANEIIATKLLFELLNNSENRKDFKEVEEVEKYFSRAIELDSSYAIPKKRLGYINVILYNKPAKGRAYLLDYSKIVNDTDAETLALIALSYENEKKFSKAISYFYKSFKVDSNQVNVLEKIANFNFNNNKLDSALYLNKRIMQIQPNSPKPYENIAKYYYVLKDTAKINYYIKLRNEKMKNIK